MNTEIDCDLASEEQEQLSGGLFSLDDFPGGVSALRAGYPKPTSRRRFRAAAEWRGMMRRPLSPTTDIPSRTSSAASARQRVCPSVLSRGDVI
jgi:hypothetical protein